MSPVDPGPPAPRRGYQPPAMADLAQRGLGEGLRLRSKVTSGSMAPLLRQGEFLRMAAPGSAPLRPGDLVVLRLGSELMTHRLLGQQQGRWLAKGDNRSHVDPPLSEPDILGRVDGIERDGRWIDLHAGPWPWLGRQMARLGTLEARVLGTWPGTGRTLDPTRAASGPLHARWIRLAALPFRVSNGLLVRAGLLAEGSRAKRSC